ncbi:MAG: hypothetical protein KW806_00510 [Candidatus Yanofskybacteria bacterium]|nr:hypothetical protein [Candidatus Yanofskybacteria bacterium]
MPRRLLTILIIILLALGAKFLPFGSVEGKTYQNNELSIYFQYPDDFSFCDTPTLRPGSKVSAGLVRTPNCERVLYDPPEIRISIVNLKSNQSLEERFVEEFPRFNQVKKSKIKLFKVDGFAAYGGEMVFEQNSEYGVLIDRKSDLILIESPFYISPNSSPFSPDLSTKEAIDKLMSTLQLDIKPVPKELTKNNLVLSYYDNKENIQYIDLETRKILETKPSREVTDSYVQPSKTSPDGKYKIQSFGVFEKLVSISDNKQYILRIDADPRGAVWNSQWSPDGKYVAFLYTPFRGYGNILQVIPVEEILSQNFSDSSKDSLTNGDDFRWVDNDLILIWQNQIHSGSNCIDSGNITAFRRGTRTFEYPLLRREGGIYQFAISPDNKLFAYQKAKYNSDGLWIGDAIVISTIDGKDNFELNGFGPSWSGNPVDFSTKPKDPNCY